MKENTEIRRLPSKSFQNLIVWQKVHQFVLEAYKVTKGFPKEELFGLTSQFRRAAISIAANISEGYKKYGLRDKIKFFNTAQGSLEECRYYLILSRDLFYLETFEDLDNLLDEIGRLLYAYINTIRKTVP